MRSDDHRWEGTVPYQLRSDPIWRMEAFRLGLRAADLAWPDLKALQRQSLTAPMAYQLVRSLGSITANITEGYGRGFPADRSRFFGMGLGSARESVVWYAHARHHLPPATIDERIDLLTQVVRLLTRAVQTSRDAGSSF